MKLFPILLILTVIGLFAYIQMRKAKLYYIGEKAYLDIDKGREFEINMFEMSSAGYYNDISEKEKLKNISLKSNEYILPQSLFTQKYGTWGYRKFVFSSSTTGHDTIEIYHYHYTNENKRNIRGKISSQFIVTIK